MLTRRELTLPSSGRIAFVYAIGPVTLRTARLPVPSAAEAKVVMSGTLSDGHSLQARFVVR